jgi:Xaa-Pro aminopeptidase
MEIWEGRRPGIEGALAQGIVDEAHSAQDLSSVLAPLIDSCKVVMLRRGVNNEVDALVDTHVLGRSRARQRHGTGPITIEDPSSRLSELRLRKTEAEVAWMRHASNISARAHVAAMRMPPSGLNERHLQAVIEGAFVYGGASGWAYPSIVGCGENATILHYTVNDSPCAEGDIVLIDAGAEVHGYASDITRSWPVGGRFNDAQREIYSIVLAAQEAAIAECKVGRPSDAPHAVARRVLAEGLIALGVIDQALEDALDLDHGQLAHWYMHGTGHWLGLDVHDVGVYSPGGAARPFESGMVITVEPGLYFGAWRPDVTCPERYANIGIRIEDDVLITDDGPVVLTADCPKTIEEIEAIMGS